MTTVRTEASAIVGRQDELAALARAVDAAAAGTLQVVAIGGAAGIGKSRVASEGLALARTHGFTTLRAAAGALEQDLSYAPVVQALRPLLDAGGPARRRSLTDGLPDLARLFDGLELPAPQPLGDAGLERTRLFEAVRRVLERAAARAPVAILLDDVQWADPATRALLAYLTRGLAGSRLLILLTHRVGEPRDAGGGADALLVTLHRTGSVTDLMLDGLAGPDMVELATDLLGDEPPAALLDLVAERAAGVPLFVQALVSMLVADGSLRRSGGRWLLAASAGRAVPRLVRTLVQQRIDALPAPARRVLDVISLGGGATTHAITRIGAGDETTAVAAVGELRTAGLVREELVDGAVAYRAAHPMLAEVAYEAMPVARRQGLHAEVAAALQEQANRDVRLLGHHLRGAGPAVDPARAYPVLVRATDLALARRAGDEAFADARAALDLLERHALGGDRVALLDRLAEGGQMAGLLDRSLEALVDAAAACGDLSGRARRLGTASLIAWDLGMFEVARRHLGEARAVLAGVPPGQAHVYVTEIELRHSGRAGDRRPRDDAIAMMQRLAAATGSARARAILMYGQVMQDIDCGQLRRALSRLEEMLVLGAGLDDPLFIERAMRPMAEAWLCWGDLEAAADAALEGVRMARLCGVPTLEAGHLTHLSLVESSRGRYQQALRLAAEVIEIGERSAMARAITFGMAAQALTLVRQERYEHARDVLADVQARFGQWADADRHVFSVVDIARSMLALHRGDPAEAVAVSRACVQRLPALKVFAEDVFGQALVGAGELDEALEVAARLRGEPPHGDLRGLLGDRIEAQVARARGRSVPAADLFDRGADRFERYGMGPDAALARLDAAELRAAPGGVTASVEAVSALETALATLEGNGLRSAADRCRWVLRTMGRRQAASTRARRPESAAGQLSVREGEVVRLVAAGLSNAEVADRLFISRRTVTTHLQHVYARLGFSSRTALTRWVLHNPPQMSSRAPAT